MSLQKIISYILLYLCASSNVYSADPHSNISPQIQEFNKQDIFLNAKTLVPHDPFSLHHYFLWFENRIDIPRDVREVMASVEVLAAKTYSRHVIHDFSVVGSARTFRFEPKDKKVVVKYISREAFKRIAKELGDDSVQVIGYGREKSILIFTSFETKEYFEIYQAQSIQKRKQSALLELFLSYYSLVDKDAAKAWQLHFYLKHSYPNVYKLFYEKVIFSRINVLEMKNLMVAFEEDIKKRKGRVTSLIWGEWEYDLYLFLLKRASELGLENQDRLLRTVTFLTEDQKILEEQPELLAWQQMSEADVLLHSLGWQRVLHVFSEREKTAEYPVQFLVSKESLKRRPYLSQREDIVWLEDFEPDPSRDLRTLYIYFEPSDQREVSLPDYIDYTVQVSGNKKILFWLNRLPFLKYFIQYLDPHMEQEVYGLSNDLHLEKHRSRVINHQVLQNYLSAA